MSGTINKPWHDNLFKAGPFAAEFLDPGVPVPLMEKVLLRFGKLDFLINNAGTAENVSFEETSVKQWGRIIDINARAPFFLCQAALPHLKKYVP